jgi:hypothetical protein
MVKVPVRLAAAPGLANMRADAKARDQESWAEEWAKEGKKVLVAYLDLA